MRSAFESWLVHNHKSTSSRISAICLSDDGSRLYVGLSDGLFEEHKLSHGQESITTTLVAKKNMGKTVRCSPNSRGPVSDLPVFGPMQHHVSELPACRRCSAYTSSQAPNGWQSCARACFRCCILTR